MIHLSTGANFRNPSLYEHMWYAALTLLARGDLRSGMGAYANGDVRDALSFMERHLIRPDRPGVSLTVAPSFSGLRRYAVRTDQSATCDRYPTETAALSSVPVPDDSYP